MTVPTKPATSQSDNTTLAQLKALGFSDERAAVPRRLICAVEGLEFSGKTHFALTAPEPIIFFDVDLGTEGVIHKFQDQGKKILVYRIKVPRGAAQDTYLTLWVETKSRMQKAYSLTQGTVIWDTETEINELARLAKFGKLTQVMPHDYAKVNREMRDVIDWAYESDMSSIFIRKLKPKWVNNARTSEYEAGGWGDMEYKAQVNLRMTREDGEGGPQFVARIKKCRQNPNVNGEVLRGPFCNFEFLLGLIHDAKSNG